MDNQHQQIKGYRELTQEEIDLMNEVKALENQAGALMRKWALLAKNDAGYIDPRCVAEARTCLQTGFMWWVRAIAQPESDLNPPR